jgi:large-conductance mechanosensitive channel|tara:strand:+ start:317 stop:727 length:411 start_codon:yes stop_codon:yes gene_type:complete
MQQEKNLTKKELKQFGIILGILVSIMFGIFIPWIWDLNIMPNYYVIGSGIIIIAFSLILPSKVIYIYKPYMKFALFIGNIINFIILGIVFFIVITFVSLLIKLLRIDILNDRYQQSKNTYRINSIKPKKNHFERPF